MMTINQLAAIFFALLIVWFVVFIWWVVEDLDVKERVMFSLLGLLIGLLIGAPASIVLWIC